MLTEVSLQLKWHGERLKAEEWKTFFMAAFKREMRLIHNMDHTGYVDIGRSTSALSKPEMSDLMELIHQFGANHGVRFADDDRTPPIEVEQRAMLEHKP
jgi:hypothetical protein